MWGALSDGYFGFGGRVCGGRAWVLGRRGLMECEGWFPFDMLVLDKDMGKDGWVRTVVRLVLVE